MLDLFPSIPTVAEVVILLAGAVGAVFALKKSLYDPMRSFNRKINAGMDTLLGYEAVVDPGSGKELKPPTPPLAQRVDGLEDALKRLVDYQESAHSTDERITRLEATFTEHLTWSASWKSRFEDDTIAWQREHESMHLLANETAQRMKETES